MYCLFNLAREQDIKNAIQSISNQLTLQLEAVEMWKEECFKVEEKYEDILKEQSTVEDLKNQLAQQSVLLQKSKVEVSTYKNHLDEAMRRMKNGSDSTIDKYFSLI